MSKQQTKAIPDLPRALYGCEEQGCAEEASHFPEDLWLILAPPKGWDPGWYCEGCADEARFQNPDSQIGETLEHYLGMERDKVKAVNAGLIKVLESCDIVLMGIGPDPCGFAAKLRRSIRAAIAKSEGA